MLVLTRRENEEICIGDNIRISVVRTSGSKVRLAIEAPDDVRITRAELLELDGLELDAPQTAEVHAA